MGSLAGSSGVTLLTMTDVWQVSTVTASKETAEMLARSAVELRLAAGAQVNGPILSTFWHSGKFGTGEEWSVILKTTESCYKRLEEHLIRNHEWANPEVTAVQLVAGSESYLAWVAQTVMSEKT